MTARISVGTIISISASAPATFDSAGYAALTWAAIGEITNAGDISQEWQMAAHTPLATGNTENFKGTSSAGAQEFGLALDTDNAGQVLAKAASLSRANYSFKQEMPNGDVYYSRGLVSSFAVGAADGGVQNASMTVTRNFSGTAPWIEALAA